MLLMQLLHVNVNECLCNSFVCVCNTFFPVKEFILSIIIRHQVCMSIQRETFTVNVQVFMYIYVYLLVHNCDKRKQLVCLAKLFFICLQSVFFISCHIIVRFFPLKSDSHYIWFDILFFRLPSVGIFTVRVQFVNCVCKH